MVLSVISGPRELRAAVIGMKAADKGMRKRINDSMRNTFNPIWKQSLEKNKGGFTRADDMLLKGARIKAGNPPCLVAASSRARFGRALRPAEHWPLVEFGVSRTEPTNYERRSPKGKVHNVKRRTKSGWPKRQAKGRIATPAANKLIPRIASYWIQSVARTWYEAMEGGS